MKYKYGKAGSLITQILILVVLFVIVFILLARANLVQLPGFMKNFLTTEQTVNFESTHNSGEIFQFMGSAPKNSDEFKDYPSITVENMNLLLNSLVPHKNFYWESTSRTIYGDSEIKKNCKSRISGTKYNVEIYNDEGSILRKFISNGEKTLVTKFVSASSSSSVYDSGIFDFYSDAGLISVDYFKNTDFSNGECEIRLIENNQYSLVSVMYTYERNGVTVKNVYGISLDYGVVLFAECFENDVLIFKQSTSSIYPLASLDDKLFAVN